MEVMSAWPVHDRDRYVKLAYDQDRYVKMTYDQDSYVKLAYDQDCYVKLANDQNCYVTIRHGLNHLWPRPNMWFMIWDMCNYTILDYLTGLNAKFI